MPRIRLFPKAVVSVSGGKDSTATAICALEAYGSDRVELVHAWTGHEHEVTETYILETLPRALGKQIHIVKADFTEAIEHKREVVQTKWVIDLAKGKDGYWMYMGDADALIGCGEVITDNGRTPPALPTNIYRGAHDGDWVWSPAVKPKTDKQIAKIVENALSVLHPTGNPFLDLCLVKGRFPSRKAQFCTQELKRYPLDNFMIDLMLQGHAVESWQGVRRDESSWRSNALPREATPEGWDIVRPIVDWTAQQTIDFVSAHGIPHNPLYSMDCGRVGCMLCINSRRDEISNAARRWPHHIERMRKWEKIVSLASKRQLSTFFAMRVDNTEDDEAIVARYNIDSIVKWSMQVSRHKEINLFKTIDPPACSSIYGLCE